MLTLSRNRFLSKLKLATVADDDRNLRAVFFVCRDVHDFRDDVFVSTDHPTKHHMFAWWKRGTNQQPRWVGEARFRVRQSEFVNKKKQECERERGYTISTDGKLSSLIMKEKGKIRGITYHLGGGTASG